MRLEHIDQYDVSALDAEFPVVNQENARVSQIEDAFIEVMVMKAGNKFIVGVAKNTVKVILVEGLLGQKLGLTHMIPPEFS